jgi:hypothetical protein
MTETWTQNSGLNPRSDDWDWWEPDFEQGPVAVSFEPFHGLWPIYCDCYAINDGYAVLKVPAKAKQDLDYTAWFPPDQECWIAVPEIFVRPQ